MAEDQLRTLIDALRTRLQVELGAQLEAVAESHEQSLAGVRKAADAEAEKRLAAKIEATQAEWTARLRSEVAATRSEVERTMVAESMRIRVEAEQAAAEAASEARRELEQAVAAERQRGESELAAERRRGESELAAERQRWESERAVERQHVESQLAEERRRADSDLEEERERALSLVEAETARMQALIDAERRAAGELARARAAFEAERQGGEGELAQARAAFEAERQRGEGELAQARAALQAERQRGEGELAQARAALQAERKRGEGELAEARAAFEAERDRASHAFDETQRLDAPAKSTSGLLDAVRAIDAASSLTDTLAAAVRGAALEAPRTALFVVSGTELREWPVSGVPTVHAGPIKADGPDAGLLGEVLRRHEPMTSGSNGGSSAPAFAALPAGRVALAVPFVLGGQTVAVLYADEGVDGQAPPSWQERVQVLGRHASACVASLTAVRTAQAMRLIGGGVMPMPAPGRDLDQLEQDDAQAARRYARLLVSEIKLYNEGQVRMGRERKDLMSRLRPEIERAHRLYDERIAPSIRSRDVYFQQELVQTLADGDQSLLG